MRKLTLRPNQRFFLNVAGKIEEYRFVQAQAMFDGSVSITAHQPGCRIMVTLLACRGYVEREYSQVEPSRFFNCTRRDYERHRRISFWCGIYFTRRRAKTGVSTTQPWLEPELEITSGPMSERDAIFARLAGAITRTAQSSIEAMRKMDKELQPTAKLEDLMGAVVGTTSTVKTPTFKDLSELEYQLSQYDKRKRPVSMLQTHYGLQIRAVPNIITIKGGI